MLDIQSCKSSGPVPAKQDDTEQWRRNKLLKTIFILKPHFNKKYILNSKYAFFFQCIK